MQNDEHTCKYNIDKMVTTDLHYGIINEVLMRLCTILIKI